MSVRDSLAGTGADNHQMVTDVIDDLATVLFDLDTRGLTTRATTAEITHAIVRWAASRGWRVRTEVRVEPPQSTAQSRVGYVDVVVREGSGPDLAIEIDSEDKRWSVEKLRYAAAAGMQAVWVRWGDDQWAGVLEGVDVIQLPARRKSGRRPNGEELTLW